ncbi:hypothetical protein O0L34_g13356 [Tuta absoluta]|nr:hypothetical protein O0L34_g13356 [Tuta absoluta]
MRWVGYCEQIENSCTEMVVRLQPLTSAAKKEVENLGHSVLQLAEDYYYKDDPPDPTDGRDVYYDTTTVATTSSEELYYDDEVLTTVNSKEPVLTSISPQEYGENRDVVKIVIQDKTSTPTAGAHADDSSSQRGPGGRWHPNILLDIVSKLDEASKETVKAEEWVPDREPAAHVIPPTRVYLDDILQTTPMASQFADQNAFYEVDNMSERDRLGMAGRGLGKDSRRRDEDVPTRSTATHQSLTNPYSSVSNEDVSEESSTGINSLLTTPMAELATIAKQATIAKHATMAEAATRARPTTEAKQSRRMTRTKTRRRKIKKLTIAHFLTKSRRKKTRYGTTTAPLLHIDVPRLIKIITNLTMDYSSNLTDLVNKTLQDMSNFSCPKLTTLDHTITTPVTVETTTADPYGNLTGTIMAKCFVCGLEESMMPRDARCADAFAGDFIPLVAVDASAKKMVSSYRKYCRWMNVPKYIINETDPRSMWGRWTGGCSVRWIDISGIYTQRTCRNRHRAVMGNHWGSKRMAKLEMALQRVDNACIISPMASLVPLSRGISLYARFHACVCTGSWCNRASTSQHWMMNTWSASLVVAMVFVS